MVWLHIIVDLYRTWTRNFLSVILDIHIWTKLKFFSTIPKFFCNLLRFLTNKSPFLIIKKYCLTLILSQAKVTFVAGMIVTDLTMRKLHAILVVSVIELGVKETDYLGLPLFLSIMCRNFPQLMQIPNKQWVPLVVIKQNLREITNTTSTSSGTLQISKIQIGTWSMTRACAKWTDSMLTS